MNNHIQPQLTINPYELENVKCDLCGGIYFVDVHVIKIVPKIRIGAKEDQHHVLNALQCVNCKHVPNGHIFELSNSTPFKT
jgi:hypothetical protein